MDPEPFQEYILIVPGLDLVTVIDPEGEPGYRVRLLNGQVTAFPAVSGEPSQSNALADITHALATPPPPAVPPAITPAQFMAAARKLLGITEGTIYALISAIPDNEAQDDARDLFERATRFRRDNPLIAALAAINGNTGEQIDGVFRLGATLFNE